MSFDDLFSTREMTDALVTEFAPRSFLLNLAFNDVETHSTKHVDIQVYKGKRKMAPFVGRRSKGRAMRREAASMRSYTPPYVKPYRSTDAENILVEPVIGQHAYSAFSPQEKAARLLGKDLSELAMYIERREEWMAAQAIFTGQIEVSGYIDEGDDTSVVDDVVDFAMPAGNKITLSGAALWSDAAVTGQTIQNNLRTWKRRIAQLTGRTARNVVVGQSVADIVVEKSKDNIDTDSNYTLGRIAPEELPDGVTYIGYLRWPGVDLWAYDEWYVDDAGAEQPMVPENKIAMIASGAMATRHYGAISDLEAIREGMAESRYFAKSWEEPNPSGRMVLVQSAPVVVPHEIEGFLYAQVLA